METAPQEVTSVESNLTNTAMDTVTTSRETTPPTPPKKKFGMGHILGIVMLVLIVAGIPLSIVAIKTQQNIEQSAQLNTLGPYDSCKKLKIVWQENINGQSSCPEGQKNANVSSYGTTITIQSNDGKPHSFKYITYSNVCANGTHKPCVENAKVVEATANTSTTIVFPMRSPVTGSKCGTYQNDFVVTAVDGNTSCHYGDPKSTVFGSPGPGGAGFCATGINCPAPTYTPTPKPTNTPTPTPKPTPGVTITPTPSPCVTPGEVKNVKISCPTCVIQ